MRDVVEAIKTLEKYKVPVWAEIKSYLTSPEYPSSFEIPPKYKSDIDDYWKVVKEYPQRQGKYLRPTLVLLVAEAMGAKKEKALKTAAAMQVSEEWLLIHDDFQDRSLMRRKKPTLHRMYGPELAVNAGDTLHVIMWKIIFDNRKTLGEEVSCKIAEEFYKILSRTAQGQAVEIAWAQGSREVFTDEDWFFIADGKTAYYTIAGPLRLGAIVAGATPAQLDKLAKFGLCLGRCFQLVDDILDLTTNYKGQAAGGDIYEGKRTLILSHLISNASPSHGKKILAIVRKSIEQKTKAEVSWVLEQMYKYKSIEYGKKIASELKEKALTIFEKDLKFLSHEPARSRLKTLTHFILERDH